MSTQELTTGSRARTIRPKGTMPRGVLLLVTLLPGLAIGAALASGICRPSTGGRSRAGVPRPTDSGVGTSA